MIAESRIIAYDGKRVTFWYRDSETRQKITVTMDKFEFVGLLLSHIPGKNFKMVRHIGIYSRRIQAYTNRIPWGSDITY
ncbi:MAG: transposase [Candidatus Methanoperedens sp.]|nr:transposase [Candidatus Methanoperedens sp.]